MLEKALEREPTNRYDTARQFGTAVIDALEGKRPWTQGELGDFVRANFAEDIGKRSYQVSNVINRTASGSSRSTMPLIVHDDTDVGDSDDDDDGFPSVETEVESNPSFIPQPTPGRAGASTDFVGGTPPPFGIESTSSAPSLQPRRGSPVMPPAPNTVVINQPRSLVWPLLAAAMVLIAGGALFLVWRQTQERQPEVKIYTDQNTSTDPDRVKDQPVAGSAQAVEPAPDLEGSGEPNGSGNGKGSAAVIRHPKQHLTYELAVASKKAIVNQCVQDHPDSTLPTVHAIITIQPNGKAKSVGFKPASYESTPLGMCIHNALMAATYPGGTRDATIDVPYSLITRPAPK